MPTNAPRHVACVMDGNGRWARQRGLAAAHGDLAAAHAVGALWETAEEEGIEWLTLLVPADRPAAPADQGAGCPPHLLTQHVLGTALERLHDEGVRVRLLGAAGPGPAEEIRLRLREAEELTRCNTRRNLTIALDDGGRKDTLDAARELVRRRVPADQVTEDSFRGYMRYPELPDVDLCIRTGGDHRLPSLLLWHCADAELVFLDVPWPDFHPDHLRYALALYRQRRLDRAPAGRSAAAAARGPGGAPTAPAPCPGPDPLTGPGPRTGEDLLPKLLRLPRALAGRLGLVLLDGLEETRRHATAETTGSAPTRRS